jgi:hypothetical protein
LGIGDTSWASAVRGKKSELRSTEKVATNETTFLKNLIFISMGDYIYIIGTLSITNQLTLYIN